MIPTTYHDGNPEDRAYAQDYWSWLQDQPQDAWLLWARRANWDNAEPIFERMIERADCDLALVSWLFWACSPADCIRNPGSYRSNSLIARIVSKASRGGGRPADLFYDRHEVAMSAHQYAAALREVPASQVPFGLPRLLCGPFTGRRAAITARYDDRTEDELKTIFHYMNGGLPRSEEEHWRHVVASGGAWLKDQMALPEVPPDPVATHAHLDDAAYVEAIFGKTDAFEAALARHRSGKRPRKPWWPFG